jgi:hypothetical protein
VVTDVKQMRIVCALKDAEGRGEVPKDISLDVAEKLWLALWTKDMNTSEEAVMQSELDPILPGGWEKWKPVPFPLPPLFLHARWLMADDFRSGGEETVDGFDAGGVGGWMFWSPLVDCYQLEGRDGEFLWVGSVGTCLCISGGAVCRV